MKNSKDDLLKRYYALQKDFGVKRKTVDDCKVDINILLKSILELTQEEGELNIREFGKFEIKKQCNASKSRITFKMSPALRLALFGGEVDEK